MTHSKKTRRVESSLLKVDYKDTTTLKNFLSKFSRIVPRAYTNTSLKEQKAIATAIKRARYMALLPYVVDYRSPNAVKTTAPAVVKEIDASATSI